MLLCFKMILIIILYTSSSFNSLVYFIMFLIAKFSKCRVYRYMMNAYICYCVNYFNTCKLQRFPYLCIVLRIFEFSHSLRTLLMSISIYYYKQWRGSLLLSFISNSLLIHSQYVEELMVIYPPVI